MLSTPICAKSNSVLASVNYLSTAKYIEEIKQNPMKFDQICHLIYLLHKFADTNSFLVR